MWKRSVSIVIVCALCGLTMNNSLAQEGVGEQVGKKIDRGIDRLEENLKQSWAQIRKSVENMGVQGRVYSRLHWDKALEKATIDVEVRDEHVVVLKGSVPNQAARQKAVQLARDTVGVTQVVDRLAVAP